MKKTLSNLILFLFVISNAYSQVSESPDYSNFRSIVTQPMSQYISPLGTDSDPVTIDGFDNFYLGVDFGEPYIATNPRDPLNSVCAFNTNNFYYTVDGNNWTKVGVPFPGFSILGDPVVCFDSLGVLFYAQLYQNGASYGVAVAKSTTKGATWSNAYNVYSTTAGLADKEWITADQTGGPFSNNLYVAWRQFGASGMRFTRSTNGGVSWSFPLSMMGSQGAYISVGPNGSIQGGSVYFARSNFNSIIISRSTDGGATFAAEVVAVNSFTGPGVICAGRYTVKGCIRTDNFPRMAADNGYTSTRGNVYIVYAGNPIGPDNADIYLVRSTNNGAIWSTPVRVNDDATTTDQWMPTISVDNNGKIFIAWYDSRIDPGNNLLTRLYGTTSTDGGLTFTSNENISNVSFNPDNMKVGQGSGQAFYIGDYIGISAIGNSSYAVWMDGRNNSLGSYVGFYPDFAMTLNPQSVNINNNDSASFIVKVPDTRGPYSERVKFTVTLDTLPASGSINFSFANGRDSISTFPDSLTLKVNTVGSVTPGLYVAKVTGRGVNGTPTHTRNIDLLVNSSRLTVGTNRNGIVSYKVNGVTYNNQQQFVFQNSSIVTVQAISPQLSGSSNYIYTHWSDNGDTTHNITVTENLDLTAFYKVQYKLVMLSTHGNTFGGNEFYDSAASFTFGVTTRTVTIGATTYYFRGWTGAGNGAYTSPDSSGNDSAVTWSLHNPIVESVRWSVISGISQLGTEIPQVYNLYQNYPNPFNPVTKIKYDIVESGNVRIVIYDNLGKEVENLVNQKHNPGRYEVDFNAEYLPSGIYYYRITVGDYVAVKKMILLK